MLAALLWAGYEPLVPAYTDSKRYDFVLDRGDRFERVQVKTGRLSDGAVVFPTSSSQAHRGGRRQSYRGQVDLFAVYCPDNSKVYLVPVAECGAFTGKLRVEAARNGQTAGVRWAANYELRAA